MRAIFSDEACARLSTQVRFLRDFNRRINANVPGNVLALLVLPFVGGRFDILRSEAPRVVGFSIRTADRRILYRSQASTFYGLRSHCSFIVFAGETI